MDGLQLTIGGAALTTIGGIVGAWIKAWSARNQKTRIEPSPLDVQLKEQFVTRREFDTHVADNRNDHENIFYRLSQNDKLTSKISGCLESIQSDLSLIKQKMFGGRK